MTHLRIYQWVDWQASFCQRINKKKTMFFTRLSSKKIESQYFARVGHIVANQQFSRMAQLGCQIKNSTIRLDLFSLKIQQAWKEPAWSCRGKSSCLPDNSITHTRSKAVNWAINIPWWVSTDRQNYVQGRQLLPTQICSILFPQPSFWVDTDNDKLFYVF